MQPLIKAQKTLFICVDVQERLLGLMAHKDEVIKNTNILLESTQILKIPLLITEQYPKGLGKTHNAITLSPNAHILEKTSFGIFGDKKIKDYITQSKCKNLVFFGIESHICVLQSLIAARDLGYECILAADACSSRNENNHSLALEFFRTQGISVLPTESILFRILGDSMHTSFKAISALVK
ncbi:isochorismatase family protein [Helicobacter sp. MIT 21-1697]|uniref:isochorismatase family protein n=1 Tax=Helicobacter sp. MIT 21-1697 TaxID=2993733 RepID=UPI00224AD478|nr:isochorismatase family protein [Helicobacter sp. MIT 21-1697]MCX2717199.1 isochorismatase family protein [Helicobacter sp. MIT 21-1697]